MVSDQKSVAQYKFSQLIVVIVSQNYIYFGNNEAAIIYIYNRTSLNQISSYRLRTSGGITDMAMFAPGLQPAATSKCISNYV